MFLWLPNNTFPIRKTKKQQTAKGLLLMIGVFFLFSFIGCVSMAEELFAILPLEQSPSDR